MQADGGYVLMISICLSVKFLLHRAIKNTANDNLKLNEGHVLMIKVIDLIF